MEAIITTKKITKKTIIPRTGPVENLEQYLKPDWWKQI
ncbi:MAG: hypothetical protein ACI82Q_002645, partial [Nonlabens sp.]